MPPIASAISRLMLATAFLSTCAMRTPAGSAEVPHDSEEARVAWVELGTNSGPIPTPEHSQPAHLLLWKGNPVLVDAGDGAAEQLAKVGVSLSQIETVFISHLHFDHIGGLFALMGLRYQGSPAGVKPLTIYGPPGTKQVVAGLRSAIGPGSALLPVEPPEYSVVELTDGSTVDLGGLTVTAAENSHYQLWEGEGGRPVSLSYRYDLPDWSVVYTGDTGPSENVEKLAQNADMLVSEIMDADVTLKLLEKDRPDMPLSARHFIQSHFTKQHLSPEEVGKLAARAGVGSLVLTHFGGNNGESSQISGLTARIAKEYSGAIMFAEDLQQFGLGAR